MSVIGTIAVNVVSRHTQFVRGINQSRRSLGTFAATVGTTDRALRTLGRTAAAGLAIFTTGRLVGKLRESAKAMDELGKTSDKLGIASERLAGLRLGGELSGLETRTVDMALQRMIRRISEVASLGKGEAAPALKELGLNAQALERLTPDQMLGRVADAMVKVTNQADRVRLAFKLFDSEGVAMVQMLQKGSAGLAEFQREAERLGIAIKREDIAKVEAFNDAMTKLGKAMGGFKEGIVIDIAPAAQTAIDALTEAMRGARQINRDISLKRGGRPGFFGRLMRGETAVQKAVTNFIVRGNLKEGVATGTPAPDMLKMLGVRGVASAMAKQPGQFSPERIQLARERGAIAEANQARSAALPFLVNKGREAGRKWIESFTAAVEGHGEGKDRVKGLGERIRDTISAGRAALVANQGRILADVFSGRQAAQREQFRLAMARIREGEQRPSDSFFLPNEGLERGTAAAYAASRASDRINRVMNEQLAVQKQTADGIRELVAQGKRVVEDVFGGA